MAHTSFFFDLDGTITDSKQGIINSVLYALDHFGIRAREDSLLLFIGRSSSPLPGIFRETAPVSRWQWKNTASISGGRGCSRTGSIPVCPRCWNA